MKSKTKLYIIPLFVNRHAGVIRSDRAPPRAAFSFHTRTARDLSPFTIGDELTFTTHVQNRKLTRTSQTNKGPPSGNIERALRSLAAVWRVFRHGGRGLQGGARKRLAHVHSPEYFSSKERKTRLHQKLQSFFSPPSRTMLAFFRQVIPNCEQCV